MGGETKQQLGPDLTRGIDLSEIPASGRLLGHAHGEAVLVVRDGEEIRAVSAQCPHYGGPLIEGGVFGHEIRCPWHHSRFDLRTGEAVGAPSLSALSCYEVTRDAGRVRVGLRRPSPAPRRVHPGGPSSVVIVGTGAAGHFAAETLRNEGYAGPVTLISAEPGLPVDRPNLSKDYLAGNAPADWIPLRGEEFFREKRITVRSSTPVVGVDVTTEELKLADGSRLAYGALLLATGASPVKLDVPGAELAHVQYVRTHADSRGIIERASRTHRAVVVGASFIGLEVAAALRMRNLEVHVVAPEKALMERVLGRELGAFIRGLHEDRGVRFHLGHTVRSISADLVMMEDGTTLETDLVVAGVGVRPNTSLAASAGCQVDRGILVNEYLETSVPGIWAAGDVARWPYLRTRRTARIEHWVVAGQQGRAAARNILGRREVYRTTPFFWSQHYQVPICYVGNAEGWETLEVSGSISGKDCLVAYLREGKIVAVATLGRDRDSLIAEDALERGDEVTLEKLVRRSG